VPGEIKIVAVEHIKIEVTSDFQSALRNSKSILADQQKIKNLQSGSQKSSETSLPVRS